MPFDFINKWKKPTPPNIAENKAIYEEIDKLFAQKKSDGIFEQLKEKIYRLLNEHHNNPTKLQQIVTSSLDHLSDSMQANGDKIQEKTKSAPYPYDQTAYYQQIQQSKQNLIQPEYVYFPESEPTNTPMPSHGPISTPIPAAKIPEPATSPVQTRQCLVSTTAPAEPPKPPAPPKPTEQPAKKSPEKAANTTKSAKTATPKIEEAPKEKEPEKKKKEPTKTTPQKDQFYQEKNQRIQDYINQDQQKGSKDISL
jgi:hypothetical protein